MRIIYSWLVMRRGKARREQSRTLIDIFWIFYIEFTTLVNWSFSNYLLISLLSLLELQINDEATATNNCSQKVKYQSPYSGKTTLIILRKPSSTTRGRVLGGDNDDQKTKTMNKKNQAHYCQESFQISSGASQETSFQLQNPNIDLGYSPDYFLAFWVWKHKQGHGLIVSQKSEREVDAVQAPHLTTNKQTLKLEPV